jgi:DNA-binding GntR family transcriptional regulator
MPRPKPAQKGPGSTPLQSELARQILDHMHRTALKTGERVRELTLAKTFGVSRTPVRAALEALETLGYVQLTPNRGFVMRRKVNGSRSPASRALRSSFDELRTQLLRDRARGTILVEVSERELMPRYGVSRGALRRVLMQLADDGLVRRQRGHGWRFAEALDSPEAVQESYRFRMVVECAGLREPAFAADPGDLKRLRKAHQDLLQRAGQVSPQTWVDTNQDFHETLAVWSGNRYILEAVRRQNALRRFREHSRFSRLTPARIVRSSREHLAILEAIEEGGVEKAARLLFAHLDSTAATIAQSDKKTRP